MVRTVIPQWLLEPLDGRCGSRQFQVSVDAQEAQCRRQRFTDHITNIVRYLQGLAKAGTRSAAFRLMTSGFETILAESDEDFLVQSIMSGVPDSTLIVLGEEGFKIEDLLQLPRLSDSDLTEQGVYIDCLKYAPGEKDDWRLYVGSGTGTYGILKRWSNYLDRTDNNTRHGKASRQSGREMNLRAVAKYKFGPEPWLPVLAEGVFMLLLGTVSDPGWRSPSFSTFVHDDLYSTIEYLRIGCDLEDPVAPGLNSTWTFTQGWRGVGIKSGAKCVDCQRVVPAAHDAAFNREDWWYADLGRPVADQLRCKNCSTYLQRNGFVRTPAMEEERVYMFDTKPKTDKPNKCEVCDEKAYLYCKPLGQWLCTMHFQRGQGKSNKAMDAPVKKQTVYPKATTPKPKECGWPECHKAVSNWNGSWQRWACSSHKSYKGSCPPIPDCPDECEWVDPTGRRCTKKAVRRVATRSKWLCAAHHDRHTRNQDMDAPFRAAPRKLRK